MSDLEAFRAETRAWLDENCPASMRTPASGEKDICWGGRHFVFQSDDQKLWLERMGARGWTVPTWPKEYGGGGLSKDEAKILAEEMKRIKARSPLTSFGIWMLGPALLKFGTHEQKLEHLPPIARGEIRWCQGYSEPNAGLTSHPWPLRPKTRAITMSSTARKSGRPTPTRPTGFSA